MIVSFSGIDSCGKGTQINLLKDYLQNRKFKTNVIWARGTWTPGVELIKKIVRRDKGFSEDEKEEYRKQARTNPSSAKLILILSIIDLIWYFGVWYRVQNFLHKVLICDRYIWDTYVDFKVNFSDFNFEHWTIWKILVLVTPKPDISVLLVITAEESYRRGVIKEEFFMESIEVKRQKVNVYDLLIQQGKWNSAIDATSPIDSVFKIIKLKLEK